MKLNSEKDIDKLLFDQVEGNLTSEQEESLNRLLTLHPEFQDELDNWKGAFVSEPLPASLAIEEKLLQIPATTGFKIVFSEFVALCLCSILLFATSFKGESPSTAEPIIKSTSPGNYAATVSNTVPQEIKQDDIISPAAPAIKKHAVAVKKEVVMAAEKTILPTEKPSVQKSEVTIEGIAPQETEPASATLVKDLVTVKDTNIIEEIVAPFEKVEKKERKTEVKDTKLSKEDRIRQRQIAKGKQKAKDLREQQEFLKGNKPYVVPLSPKNF